MSTKTGFAYSVSVAYHPMTHHLFLLSAPTPCIYTLIFFIDQYTRESVRQDGRGEEGICRKRAAEQDRDIELGSRRGLKQWEAEFASLTLNQND